MAFKLASSEVWKRLLEEKQRKELKRVIDGDQNEFKEKERKVLKSKY